MVQDLCSGTHLFSKISPCLLSHFVLAPRFWAADDNNKKKNMAPGMRANGETLLLLLPAGATLSSCIPVGTRIIQGDHSVPSQRRCLRHLPDWISPRIPSIGVGIFCCFRPAERVLLQLLHPPVILWEEGQKVSASNPGGPNNGGLGVDSPRHGHLPRREWSPFVSYCGMRRQIDEDPLIPSGPGEAAGEATVPARHHRRPPPPAPLRSFCLPHSAVM